ncbi:fatty-acid amide hydrolase 1 isoform X2 [Lingula anatina]|uniref:fatty acid amide hydrolase n=1 Tax=Lingula anatina TaxID=7574 RepID=A0A1S3H191_LINAN|nr:fatty-acid amide hydrolase 1 isoform X2 [Lingula anatina]|eukprot:XP_013379905.1 fatty-acid amide hydrolase 1 isoform X2 [Lingula anatina]
MSKLSRERIEEITGLKLRVLLEKLNSGELKSAEVLQAFQCKAVEKNRDLNFITAVIKEAQDDAVACDTASEKGPLHGLPVTIKDCVGLKGYDSTCGLVNWIGKPWEENSVLTKVLKKQGAIPFIKTNVPQTMLAYDCSNPIFGATKNPHDPSRSPGGSSGGEGAAVGSGASLVGIGTDIGGSVRVPAACCGVYGLKPTWFRISSAGNTPFYSGNKLLCTCYGVLGQDVDSLAIMMKALLCPYMFKLDPYVPPIPFQSEIYESTKPLKIGFYTEFEDFITPVPACQRAVLVAKAVLEQKGHKLIPWTPPNVKDNLFTYYGRNILADYGESLAVMLKGDVIDQCMQVFHSVRLPYFLKRIISFFIKPFDCFASRMLLAVKPFRSIYEWFNFNTKVEKWKMDFKDNWQNYEMDAVICPVMTAPALPLGYPGRAHASMAFCTLYNVLNFPAGVVPVTKVTATDMEELKNYKAPNTWQKLVKKGCEGGKGLPVAVQCVTLPFQEELCLRVMKELQEGLQYAHDEMEEY